MLQRTGYVFSLGFTSLGGNLRFVECLRPRLVEVAEGRCQLRQALIKDKRFDSLAILPAAARYRNITAALPDGSRRDGQGMFDFSGQTTEASA